PPSDSSSSARDASASAPGNPGCTWRHLGLARHLSPKVLRLDPLGFGDSHPGTCLAADLSVREDFLHRRPIRLDPAAIMTAVALGRNADLREAQSRSPTTNPRDVEGHDRIVVGPPPRGAPRLDDLAASLQHEIDA